MRLNHSSSGGAEIVVEGVVAAIDICFRALPLSALSCHLAPLAAWPDAIRFRFPWSGHLHYVNPLNDTPPEHCTYGEQGWTSDENVLSG